MISLLNLPPQLSPAARQENTIPRSGLLIGVDGGATKTIAAAYDVASQAISIGTAGPSNPESVGFQLATAIWLGGHFVAAVAYVAGTFGHLVGADILNMPRVRSLQAPMVSIGGAGTFDGVFLAGLVTVLLASL